MGIYRVLINARLHTCTVSGEVVVCLGCMNMPIRGRNLSSSDVSVSLCICVCLRVGNAGRYVCLSR